MAQYTAVLASEFNTVRNTVANVLGTGATTRGYGSPVTSYAVSAGGKISPAEFTALKTDMNVCYGHIAGTTAPGLASVVSGNSITWANLVTYQVAATYIDNNRDTAASKGTVEITRSTRSSGWGRASGVIYTAAYFGVNWGSGAAMRYFFNQGNGISIVGSAGNGDGSSKSISFANMCNSINLGYNVSNYRGGTNADYQANDATSPYSGGTPSYIHAYTTSVDTVNGTLTFAVAMGDTGNDGNVASNVGTNLTFILYANTPNNLTNYQPSCSAPGWV